MNMDHPQTSRGLTQLRKRYIRKAQTLVTDPEFRSVIVKSRQSWNDLEPEFRITPGEVPNSAGVPPALAVAVKAGTAARMRRLATGDLETPWTETERALTNWLVSVHGLACIFFRPIDFHNPYQWAVHPAIPFIAASLHATERAPLMPLVSDCASLFRQFSLSPEPMRPNYWIRPLADLVIPDRDEITWFVPLYPGITVADLRAAESQIVSDANTFFVGRTVADRIRALRNEGRSYQEIADQLGLPKRNVADALDQ